MPSAGEVVDAPGDRVLLDQRARTRASVRWFAWHHINNVPVHGVGGQLVGGQVDPFRAQILVDVTQEVGELEGFSKRRGVRRRLLAGHDRAEHGQQLQPDHLGRAVHVAVQRGPVGIVGDGQVHPHRGQEVVEQFPLDAVRARRCTTAVSTGSSPLASPSTQPREQRSGQPLQPVCAFGGVDARVEVVEDVVGAAGEPVERVHRGPLCGRQQPGRQEERAPVAAR